MTIYYILLGVLLTSIIITTMQWRLAQKKEKNELMELFEEVKIDN